MSIQASVSNLRGDHLAYLHIRSASDATTTVVCSIAITRIAHAAHKAYGPGNTIPIMGQPQGNKITYRVSGLPPGSTKIEAAFVISQLCDTEELRCQPTIHSLGSDPFSFGPSAEMIATVTFKAVPSRLQTEPVAIFEDYADFRDTRIQMSLSFDTQFHCFTPLNDPQDSGEQLIDCIAISGLASHAFGSWKSRLGPFMWLRDDTAWRTSNVRVLLYGYDSTLVESESFQTIANIGTKLGDDLSKIRRFHQCKTNFKPRPIVFVAHSLGGIVVKEAICQMTLSKDTGQVTTAMCVYGLVFFGVPNSGIRIEHWLPIVENQPNKNFIEDLSLGSVYLQGLQTRFGDLFKNPNSRILSIFETMRTRTAKLEGGRWQLKGEPQILVEELSATQPMRNASKSLCLLSMQMNRNHSELPKFSHRHDEDYKRLVGHFEAFWTAIITDVHSRFADRKTEAPFLNEATFKVKVEGTPKPAIDGYNRDDVPVVDQNAFDIASEDFINRATHLGPIKEFLESDYARSPKKNGPMSPLHYAVIRGRVDVAAWFLSSGGNVHQLDPTGATLLHAAVAAGHFDVSTLLIEHRADVHARDSQGQTPLHCVPAGGSNILNLLVGAGARIDETNSNGNSALIMAVYKNEIKRVKMFLKHGAEFNLKQPPNPLTNSARGPLSPLQVALRLSHNEVFKVLVDHGADYNVTTGSHDYPVLHYATVKGNYEAIKILISAGVDVNSKDAAGHTAIRHAVPWSDPASLKTIRLLVRARANLETLSKSGFTALHKAAECGNLAAVRTLLDNGASTETKAQSGETALFMALGDNRKTNLPVIKLLLDRGADMLATYSKKTPEGHPVRVSPPHMAATQGFLEAVTLFINQGFDVDEPDSEGYGMIYWATYTGHLAVARLLIERGARMLLVVPGHWTPLHWASREGLLDVMEFILENVGDVDCVDTRKYTPLHHAAREGHVAVVKMLLGKGAKIDAVTEDERTPLDLAEQHNHREVVVFLKHAQAKRQKAKSNQQPRKVAGGTSKKKKTEAK